MGGASSFLAMLGICGFLSSAWMASKVSQLLGVSSIVAEITVGVILGPQILGIVPEEYSVCEHAKYVDCSVSNELKNEIESFTPLDQLTLTEPLEEIAYGEHHGHPFCDYDAYMHAAHGDGHAAAGHGGAHEADDVHGGEGSHGAVGLHEHSNDGHGAGHGDHHEDAQDGHGATHANHSEGGHDDPHEHADGGHAGGHANAGHEDLHEHAADGHADGHADAGHDDHHEHADDGHADGHADVDHDDHHEHSDGHEAHTESGHGRRLSSTGQVDGFMRTRRLSGDLKYSSYDECLEMWCEQERTAKCGHTPDVFTLIGHTGVALMIFESGMHFNFDTAKVVGPPACVVAVVGTILPLVTGSLLVVIFGRPFFPDGLSAGTALAPTSVGIALKLLGEAKVLNMNFGQAIITAAFVDDILSLILFNVLFALGGGELGFGTFLPSLIGIAFMLVATALAVKFWPKFIADELLPRVPVRDPNAKISSKDEALFFTMMLLMVVYACITHFCGTHLWGCFIAGMSFASLKPEHYAHGVWETQTKRVTKWLLRIFFCGTVAWSIPVSSLMSFEAFWKGTLMGIGPTILTKVCCGPFMGNARWVIGWAMVGRAEFAYLIAQMAAAGNMMDEMTYSVCIWALLYATVFAPFIFRAVLKRYIENEGIVAEGDAGHGHGHGHADAGAAANSEAEANVVHVADIDFTGAFEDEHAHIQKPPKIAKGRGTSCGSIFGCFPQEQPGLKP